MIKEKIMYIVTGTNNSKSQDKILLINLLFFISYLGGYYLDTLLKVGMT